MSTQDNNFSAAEEVQLLEKLVAADERLRTAVSDVASATSRYYFMTGWKDGYDRGWKDAIESLANQAVGYRKPTPPQPPIMVPAAQTSQRPRLGTKELVVHYLDDHPGARGVEVASALGKSGISERTVRTALHRLKRDGLVEVRDGGWHLIEDNKS